MSRKDTPLPQKHPDHVGIALEKPRGFLFRSGMHPVKVVNDPKFLNRKPSSLVPQYPTFQSFGFL